MTADGVLFDFSGTLLRVEPARDWVRLSLAELGRTLPEAELAELTRRLEEAGAQPGGAQPAAVPERLKRLWDERDVGAAEHRLLYTSLARQVPVPDPALYDVLYERHMRPEAWQPYPDTGEVLRTLHARGVPVAVVSNIGWDLRPVFREHGLDAYVRRYVLSFEHGVQKPDPRLFRVGCAALELPPERVLMVGDSAEADGGARALGCALHLVPHLPVTERPDALLPVLRAVG